MISLHDEAAVVVREDGKVIRVLLKHNGNPPELYDTTVCGLDAYKDLLKHQVGYKLTNEGTPTKTEDKPAK